MEKIISIITSLIGCVTLFVKTFFGKSKKRESGYYEKVLKPYVCELSKNRKLNTISVVSELVDKNDDDIPKYVLYLLDNNQGVNLNKVLICDYCSLYPNDDNTVYMSMDRFMKLLYYILFFIAMYFLVYAIFIFLNGISNMLLFGSNMLRNEMVEGENIKESKNILGAFLTSFIFIGGGMGIIKLDFYLNEDRYEIKMKKIVSMIKRKIRKYDKMSHKFMV